MLIHTSKRRFINLVFQIPVNAFFLKKGTHLGSVHVSCYNHISFYTHLPVYSKIFCIPDNAVDLQKLRTLVIGQLLFKVSLKKTVVYPTFVNAFSV